jgi:hydrogenase nickel incorporation protein HypA/HybF
MHEAGLMNNIIGIVTQFALENGATKVQRILLDIGAISGIVPEYLSFYFEPCSRGTILEGAQLEINFIPAIGKCSRCLEPFGLLENDFICPDCQDSEWELVSGSELDIQGIEVV